MRWEQHQIVRRQIEGQGERDYVTWFMCVYLYIEEDDHGVDNKNVVIKQEKTE